MKLDFIDIANLKISPLNVRKHGETSGDDLIPSIKANGVIQPLLVRPNCEGYDVIAGQRRFRACQAIAKEGAVDPIPCAILEDGDDAKAIEASLAENIARLPMDEIDQYEAFRALTKQGRSVADIASHFGVTERLVAQRLAIANLYPPILKAYRREEVKPQEIRLLTMASTKQQRAWFKLFKESEHPNPWQLKSWLFGGEEIPTDNALFDLNGYKGVITADLFGEESYFADPTQFWEHQSHAIADLKQELEDDGWTEVVILDVGEQWSKWEHSRVAKEDGGKVYIQVRSDGEVTIHEGLLPEKEAKRLALAASGEEPQKADRPELTKSMQNYLNLHRHAAVRAELLAQRNVALRLAVAQIIAGSNLWSVSADSQKTNTSAIAKSLSDNRAETVFDQERLTIRSLLGFEDETDDQSIVPRQEDWGLDRDCRTLFTRLMELDDDTVSRILTFVVAETLPCGSEMMEQLGLQLSTDMRDHWAADQNFFDLLKDKEAINAMLAEIGGKSVAKGNLTATAKAQKQIIQDFITGENGRKANRDWQPRYMQFPMRGYTKRQDTIEAVPSTATNAAKSKVDKAAA